ncbi:MAG: hypothetical protein ABSF45_17455 [Terriglobia bacterium]|jgi:hypothetical protein
MKLAKTLSVTIVAMAFFVAVAAAAKPKDYRSVVLHSDATVAGTHLGSGTYSVQWQTQSPEATVSFSQGSKVVATAEGKLVDSGRKYDSNEVMYDEAAGGGRVIREIRFKGSSEVLEFN